MLSWIGKWLKWENESQQSLKEKGFDPSQIEYEDQQINQNGQNKSEQKQSFGLKGYVLVSPEDLAKELKQYDYYYNKEDVRHPFADPKGGVRCADPSHVSKLRGVGKQMIKQIGKKLISGDFNLTKISFPLTAMIPQTSLQNAVLGSSMMPYFAQQAVEAQDVIQRFRFVITAILSPSYAMNLFLKPINPILGETLQKSYPDGTQVYCQQISHHPPVSYFLVVGPKDSYRYYGYYNFSGKAGLNSGTLNNTGNRYFQVGDQIIKINFTQQKFSNVFIGTLRLQSQGQLIFNDEKNDLKATIEFGKLKNKPTDYFQSQIYQKGKPVGQFNGTYLGHINFDKFTRYWDCRFLPALQTLNEQNPLCSDSSLRHDIYWMKSNDLQKAQTQKDVLQNLQRHDAKIRKKVSCNIH